MAVEQFTSRESLVVDSFRSPAQIFWMRLPGLGQAVATRRGPWIHTSLR